LIFIFISNSFFQIAAVAAVNMMGNADDDGYFKGSKPFHSRRRSALAGWRHDEAELTEEQKRDRMVQEVDEMIYDMKEAHSLEKALTAKKHNPHGTKYLDSLVSTIVQSRNLF
jgi:hypothetical protein